MLIRIHKFNKRLIVVMSWCIKPLTLQMEMPRQKKIYISNKSKIITSHQWYHRMSLLNTIKSNSWIEIKVNQMWYLMNFLTRKSVSKHLKVMMISSVYAMKMLLKYFIRVTSTETNQIKMKMMMQWFFMMQNKIISFKKTEMNHTRNQMRVSERYISYTFSYCYRSMT